MWREQPRTPSTTSAPRPGHTRGGARGGPPLALDRERRPHGGGAGRREGVNGAPGEWSGDPVRRSAARGLGRCRAAAPHCGSPWSAAATSRMTWWLSDPGPDGQRRGIHRPGRRLQLGDAPALEGTARRTAARLAADLESLGGRLTTGGGKEAASISLLCASDVLDPASISSSRRSPSRPFQKASSNRRQAAIARIRARNDQLLGSPSMSFTSSSTASTRTTSRRPATSRGQGAQAQRCRDFLRAHGHGANMVASVVGRVDLDRVAARLDQGLARSSGTRRPRPLRGGAGPGRGIEHRTRREDRADRGRLPGSSRRPSGFGGHRRLLGRARRLHGLAAVHRAPRPRGLAYEIGALYAGYVGPSFLAGYMERAESRPPWPHRPLRRDRAAARRGTKRGRVRARPQLPLGSQLMALERNANARQPMGSTSSWGSATTTGTASSSPGPGDARRHQAGGRHLARPASMAVVLPLAARTAAGA